MASTSGLWKGKGKATDAELDFDDLNPVITYRHLLADPSVYGPRDPLRVIALCDSDAFYAACEIVRLGLDTSVPLVVLQWDSLIAVSYPARKYGISRMDKLKDAKRKCPDLVVQHVATYKEGDAEPGYWDHIDSRTHKVSLDHYRRESQKILARFQDGAPTAEIEKASIDEAFLDFTRPVRAELLKRYPHLAAVPDDAPHGIDTPLPPPPPISWEDLGVVIPLTETGDGEEQGPESEESPTWHDVALSIAAETMDKIRKAIHTELGYTLSAGISRNKFLAKLSASYRKPNTQNILRNAAIPAYLRPLGFQKIRFLGGKLGEAIAKEYDVSTVGDLLHITLDEMQRKFGESALWVWEVLRGIDRSEVKAKAPGTKSMLASKNLPQPITKFSDGAHWVRVLAAELALRLTDARREQPGLWPKNITLNVRKSYDTGRSKQAPFPFSRSITVDLIAAAGDKLWKEIVPQKDVVIKVNYISLGFHGLDDQGRGQQNIDNFLGGSKKRPRDLDAEEQENISKGKSVDVMGFSCPKCRKTISLPLGASFEDEDEKDVALVALRAEHDDFHFAQDLARQDHDGQNISPPKKKKKGSEARGIAKFFKPA